MTLKLRQIVKTYLNHQWDLSIGFQVEEPQVFIPWDITTTDFLTLVNRRHLGQLKRVTERYYVLPCTILDGLQINLGFHFREGEGKPEVPGRLKELEVFRDATPALQASYQEFQAHLTRVLGRPTAIKTEPNQTPLPMVYWKFEGSDVYKYILVRHYILDRYGPEEHVSFLLCNRKTFAEFASYFLKEIFVPFRPRNLVTSS